VKYILLIYGDERVWASMTKDEMEKIYADHRAYGEAMGKAGVIKGVPDLDHLADTLRECSLRERARRRVTTFVEA